LLLEKQGWKLVEKRLVLLRVREDYRGAVFCWASGCSRLGLLYGVLVSLLVLFQALHIDAMAYMDEVGDFAPPENRTDLNSNTRSWGHF